jgi:uncharacterized protein DUF4157
MKISHACGDSSLSSTDSAPAPAPGKRTLTMSLPSGARIQRRAAERSAVPERAASAPDYRADWGSISGGIPADPDAVVAGVSGSTGGQLPDPLQARLSGALGVDVSGVRVHTDATAASAAEALSARAFTVGQDVHFGAGQYDPETPAGDHLIAHEVAHTVQQRGGAPAVQHKLEVSQPGDALESEADRFADAFVQGSPAPGALTATSAQVARETFDLPPVVIGRGRGGAGGQAESDSMVREFPEIMRGFCRDWCHAASFALHALPNPDDPYAAANFDRALAGNLAWAATSLTYFERFAATTPPGRAALVVTSGVGAIAGTGTFSTPPPPSGRGEIVQILEQTRGLLERHFTASAFINDAVARCLVDPAGAHDPGPELWQRFARGIPFHDRAEVMGAQIRQKLARWLASFQRQWLDWKESIEERARELELADYREEAFLDQSQVGLRGFGPINPYYLAAAERQHPFVPVFQGSLHP